MSARVGRLCRIFIGTYPVVNIESFSMSGLVNEVIKDATMDKNFVEKDYGIGDFGSVEITGNYDPADTTGQIILESAALNKAKLTTLYLGIDSFGTSQWEPNLTADSSACAIVSKYAPVSADKSEMAKVAITIELGGKWLMV